MYPTEKELLIALLEFELDVRLRDQIKPDLANILILVATAALELIPEKKEQ